MLQSTLLNSASRPDPTRQSHALWLPRHTHPSMHYLPGRWTTAHSTNPTAPRTERRSHFLTHHAEAVQQEEQARCDARLSRNEGRHVSGGQHDESEEHRRGERHEVPHVGGQPVGLEAHAGYHLWADTEPYHKRGRGGTKTSSIGQRDLRVTHSAVPRYLTVLKLVHSSRGQCRYRPPTTARTGRRRNASHISPPHGRERTPGKSCQITTQHRLAYTDTKLRTNVFDSFQIPSYPLGCRGASGERVYNGSRNNPCSRGVRKMVAFVRTAPAGYAAKPWATALC